MLENANNAMDWSLPFYLEIEMDEIWLFFKFRHQW
jgi:hypothetical protein